MPDEPEKNDAISQESTPVEKVESAPTPAPNPAPKKTEDPNKNANSASKSGPQLAQQAQNPNAPAPGPKKKAEKKADKTNQFLRSSADIAQNVAKNADSKFVANYMEILASAQNAAANLSDAIGKACSDYIRKKEAPQMDKLKKFLDAQKGLDAKTEQKVEQDPSPKKEEVEKNANEEQSEQKADQSAKESPKDDLSKFIPDQDDKNEKNYDDDFEEGIELQSLPDKRSKKEDKVELSPLSEAQQTPDVTAKSSVESILPKQQEQAPSPMDSIRQAEDAEKSGPMLGQ